MVAAKATPAPCFVGLTSVVPIPYVPRLFSIVGQIVRGAPEVFQIPCTRDPGVGVNFPICAFNGVGDV
jgi:hypothetical protein